MYDNFTKFLWNLRFNIERKLTDKIEIKDEKATIKE
jgi:hypothetical protein